MEFVVTMCIVYEQFVSKLRNVINQLTLDNNKANVERY